MVSSGFQQQEGSSRLTLERVLQTRETGIYSDKSFTTPLAGKASWDGELQHRVLLGAGHPCPFPRCFSST